MCVADLQEDKDVLGVQGAPGPVARQDNDKMSVEARCGSSWKRPGGDTWWVQRGEQEWTGWTTPTLTRGCGCGTYGGEGKSGLAWSRPRWQCQVVNTGKSLGESLRCSCRSGLLSLNPSQGIGDKAQGRLETNRLSSHQSIQEVKSEDRVRRDRQQGAIANVTEARSQSLVQIHQSSQSTSNPRTTIKASPFSFAPPAMR